MFVIRMKLNITKQNQVVLNQVSCKNNPLRQYVKLLSTKITKKIVFL